MAEQHFTGPALLPVRTIYCCAYCGGAGLDRSAFTAFVMLADACRAAGVQLKAPRSDLFHQDGCARAAYRALDDQDKE